MSELLQAFTSTPQDNNPFIENGFDPAEEAQYQAGLAAFRREIWGSNGLGGKVAASGAGLYPQRPAPWPWYRMLWHNIKTFHSSVSKVRAWFPALSGSFSLKSFSWIRARLVHGLGTFFPAKRKDSV